MSHDRGDSGASEDAAAGLPRIPLGMTKGGGLKWPSLLALTALAQQQAGVQETTASGQPDSAAESGSARRPEAREVQP